MDRADITTPSMASATAQPLRLSWRHPAGLLGLSTTNYVLRIITLGVYNFWGKTEVRKRIWSSIRIEGEPLQYTGTGRELFLGFLVVFGAVVIPVMIVSVVAALVLDPESAAFDAFQLVLYAAFFFLTGIAIYRAQRYRLSRTRWRGIRGSLIGSGHTYAWTYFWTGLLIPLTAGWIVPWRSAKLQGLMTRDMRFGDRPLQFTASSGPLYGRFAILWVGAVAIVLLVAAAAAVAMGTELANFDPSAGRAFAPSSRATAVVLATLALAYILFSIASAWYRAHQINHFAAHTQFDKACFKGCVTAGGLVWIGITNILIVLLTLGLLVPVAQARATRYLIEHLEITGRVALSEIAQAADQGIGRGEGLAQAFDIDAF